MPLQSDTTGGVTRRATLIAFALLGLLSFIAFYVTIVWRWDSFTSAVPPIAQLGVLVGLGAAMGLPILRRCGLTRRELLGIYCVLLVAAPVVAPGILFWMIPKTIVYYYLARANPAWESGFLPLIPPWYSPTDPAAVEGFFLGKSAVPWSLWLLPMAAWLSFGIALFVCVACLLSLLQRQWIRGERLTFPIAQVPLEVVSQASDQQQAAGILSTRGGLWLGAGIALTLSFWSRLSLQVPALPGIPLGPVTLIPWQKVGPLAGLGAYELVLWPWLIALAYLLPKDLSFSCWFFWLVRLGLHVAGIAAGATPQRPEEVWDTTFPAPYYQGTGAVLALGLWVLWTARKHLARAVRVAVSRRAQGADADEPVPYRWALVGMIVSFAWMVCFFRLAGCRWVFGLVLVTLTLSFYLMWARLRAETGMGFLPFPLDPQYLMWGPFGTVALQPQEIISVSSARWAYSSGEGLSFDTTTANLCDAFKIADSVGLNQRRLMAASFAGLVLALVLGTYIVLSGTYHYGYFGTFAGAANYFPSLQTRYDANAVFVHLQDPTRLDRVGLVAMAVGAVTAVLLGTVRLRFWWWPLNPIGYMAANCWGWHWYVTPFVIGWLAKVLVIRYGGLRLYRATTSLAAGLIVGDMLNRCLWAFVTLLTRGQV